MKRYPKQAEFLAEVKEKTQGSTWESLTMVVPEKSLPQWLSGGRRVPEKYIFKMAEALYTDDKDRSTFRRGLRDAIEVDEAGEDANIWTRADHFFGQLRIAKLIYPPFAGHGAHFLDDLLTRFTKFVGHRVNTPEDRDLDWLLRSMISKSPTVDVGVGLFSSLQRLAVLRTLLLPIRVGLNAVILAEHDAYREEIAALLLDENATLSPRFAPIVLKNEVGYNHLIGLRTKGMADQIRDSNERGTAAALRSMKKQLEALDKQIVLVNRLRPEQYVRQLNDLRSQQVAFALVDEVTCLSILQILANDRTAARLVFPVATNLSVRDAKKELPEFMMSIVTRREKVSEFDFIRDAFWQILQTDIELLGNRYADLCLELEILAANALRTIPEGKHSANNLAREWAEYTLRLQPAFLDLYVDQKLPWKPILEKAINILAKKREEPNPVMAYAETAGGGQ